jgi:regulator of replication initiation timing
MTQVSNQSPEVSPIMQQMGMLNLRINDMMTQLNAVIKALIEENAALKKENAELKALPKGSANEKQAKTGKS